jgi:hypothetical protein
VILILAPPKPLLAKKANIMGNGFFVGETQTVTPKAIEEFPVRVVLGLTENTLYSADSFAFLLGKNALNLLKIN